MRPIIIQKQKIINLIAQQINNSKIIIVVEYQGINVEKISFLRKQLITKNSKLIIYKNNLFLRALNKEYLSLKNILIGQNGFIFGIENNLEIAKIVYNFSKKNKSLILKGGIFENKVINQFELKKIASLPSKLELISIFSFYLKMPILNLILVIKTVINQKLKL